MAKSLSKLIKEDPAYSTLLTIVKDARRNIDYEAIKKEAMTLHNTRSAPNLYGKNKMNPDKVSEADAQDLSWRSRLTKIKVTLHMNLSVIEKALDTFSNHVMVHYGQDLRSEGFNTKDQRTSFTKDLLHRHYSFMKEGQVVMEMLDWLIADIDKASFRISNMLEVIKLHYESKRKGI